MMTLSPVDELALENFWGSEGLARKRAEARTLLQDDDDDA
jgi:hypothetical protein